MFLKPRALLCRMSRNKSGKTFFDKLALSGLRVDLEEIENEDRNVIGTSIDNISTTAVSADNKMTSKPNMKRSQVQTTPNKNADNNDQISNENDQVNGKSATEPDNNYGTGRGKFISSRGTTSQTGRNNRTYENNGSANRDMNNNNSMKSRADDSTDADNSSDSSQSKNVNNDRNYKTNDRSNNCKEGNYNRQANKPNPINNTQRNNEISGNNCNNDDAGSNKGSDENNNRYTRNDVNERFNGNNPNYRGNRAKCDDDSNKNSANDDNNRYSERNNSNNDNSNQRFMNSNQHPERKNNNSEESEKGSINNNRYSERKNYNEEDSEKRPTISNRCTERKENNDTEEADDAKVEGGNARGGRGRCNRNDQSRVGHRPNYRNEENRDGQRKNYKNEENSDEKRPNSKNDENADRCKPNFRNGQNDDGRRPNYKNDENNDERRSGYRNNKDGDGQRPNYRNKEDCEERRPNYRNNKDADERRPNYRNDENRDGQRPNYRNKEDDDGQRPNYKNKEDDGERRPNYRNKEDGDECGPIYKKDENRDRRPNFRNDENRDGRKPNFRNDENRDGRRPNFRNDENNDEQGSGVDGHGRGGHQYNKRTAVDNGEDGKMERSDDKVAPVTYIPPEVEETESYLFQSLEKGKNFDKLCTYSVELTGNNAPKNALLKFEDAPVTPKILENIKKAGYSLPTPIQQWSIPAILHGRDLMACAQTGSGKTAAFLIPVLSLLLADNETLMKASMDLSTPSPLVLILTPTRELALQTHKEIRKFAFQTVIKSCCIYGGVSVSYQLNSMLKGVHVIVGTVGRVTDFARNGKIDLSHVKYLILDEADRMLNMGFHDEVVALTAKCGGVRSEQRRTMLYSATFPVEIQKLAYDILNDYLFVTVGLVGQANMDIEQSILMVNKLEKKERLKEILTEISGEKVIVFVKTKLLADSLCIQFSEELEIPMTTIHGDLSQKERELVIGHFREDRASVLCATSVAARGLDIPGVKYVINYDLPDDIDEYVHRIGRTARCGNTGKAVSFFSQPEDSELARPLVKVLTDAQQIVPDWLEELALGSLGEGRFHNDPFRTRDARKNGEFPKRSNKGSSSSKSLAELPMMSQPPATTAEDDEWA